MIEARESQSQACDVVRIGLREQHPSGVAPTESLALIEDLPEQRLAIPLHHERHPDPTQLVKLDLVSGELAAYAHTGEPRARQHARGVEHAIARKAIIHPDEGDGRARAERCLRGVVGSNEHDAPGHPAQIVSACEHRGIDHEHGGLVAGPLRKQVVGRPPPRRVRFVGDCAGAVVDDALRCCDHSRIKRTERAEAHGGRRLRS